VEPYVLPSRVQYMNTERSAGVATLRIVDGAAGLVDRINNGLKSQPQWMATLAGKGSMARPPLWVTAHRPLLLTRGRANLNGWRLLFVTKEEVAWVRVPHQGKDVLSPLRSAGFKVYSCVRKASTSIFALAEESTLLGLPAVLERDAVRYEEVT